MSSDVELIFNDTSKLFYKNPPIELEKQTYRLLDAPLTRYLIGFSRTIFNIDPIVNDWNWSESFEENWQAFPEEKLLSISRLSVAIFFPLSTLVFTLLVRKIIGNQYLLLLISTVIFSSNSLLLLHTRRAMAESLLIFFLLLSLYLMISLPPEKLWLSSIPIALAINAKQSLIFLVPVVLILFFAKKSSGVKNILFQVALFTSVLIGIFYVLNPIIWKQPIRTSIIMISERQELSRQQLLAINSVTPEFTTSLFTEKFTALIAQTFVLKPAYQDVSNYADQLQNSVANYSSKPIQNGIFRNLFFGVLFVIVSSYGVIQSFKYFSKDKIVVMLLSFIFLLVEMLLFIQIPFQRYYLPLIPYSLIFLIYGIFHLQAYFNNLAIKNNK